MAAFSTDYLYGSKSVHKRVARCTNMHEKGLSWAHQHCGIFLVYNFACKMPQNEKSSGFRSGDRGGHCAVESKYGALSLSHCWLTLVMCDRAESCWNVHSILPKCWLSRASEHLPNIFRSTHSHLPWLYDPKTPTENDHRPSWPLKPSHMVVLVFWLPLGCSNFRMT